MINVLDQQTLLIFSYILTEQIDRVRLEVQQFQELDIKHTTGPSMRVNLDIPESIGLSTPLPAPSSSRLVDLDTGRRKSSKGDIFFL
jgi:MAternally-affected-uncoordination protein